MELTQFSALLEAVSAAECGEVPGETARWYDPLCLSGVKQDVSCGVLGRQNHRFPDRHVRHDHPGETGAGRRAPRVVQQLTENGEVVGRDDKPVAHAPVGAQPQKPRLPFPRHVTEQGRQVEQTGCVVFTGPDRQRADQLASDSSCDDPVPSP